MIRVASDFSGIGAFNQALNRLDIKYEEVFACDLDKFARKTFIENYGQPNYFPKNVYDREIPAESLDIYMTSPPCQSFSQGGARLGKKDERGILFFNSHEFIKKNKPRYFIMENVRGLLSHDNGVTFQEWINMLGGKSINGLPVIFPYETAVPYHLYYKILNAKDYDIPQLRERIFLIGIRDDIDNVFTFPKKEYPTRSLQDLLQKNVDKKYVLSDKMVKYISYNREGEYQLILNRKIANCITSSIAGMQRSRVDNYIDYIYDDINTGKIRKLTPRECFRLMDFPDSFKWSCSNSQAYKQAGNSIVVKMLELIIKNLKL